MHPQLFKKRKNNSNKNKASIIRDKLSATTLQFFLKPANSDRLFLKIFWITILILSIFANVYYVFLNIIDYLDYSTTTSIYHIQMKMNLNFQLFHFVVIRSVILILKYFNFGSIQKI